jgi:hypothetical protein
MSPNIWTQCAGASRVRTLHLTAWRAVEAQHQVSTRKLVDSLEEQALLEELIEGAKPPDTGRGRLHVLIATPFRYPPLRHGSRFGTRQQRGIWYGAETKQALFAEVAYYRLVFLDGTRAAIDSLLTWHTAFAIRLRCDRGIDLTRRPFAMHHAAIASPTDYAASQELGRAMRDATVEAFRYPSARDPGRGVNVGAFTPDVFDGSRPRTFETWHCTTTRDRVEIVRRDFLDAVAFTFPRETFVVDGRLPAPAI